MKINIRINQDANTSISGEYTYAIPDSDAQTLMELFQMIEQEHAGFCESLIEDGAVRQTMIVLINGENVLYLDGLASRIREADEVYIIPSVAGG